MAARARGARCATPTSVGAYKVLARVALQRNELDLANLVALRAQKLDAAATPSCPFVVGQVLARQGDDAGAAGPVPQGARALGELPPGPPCPARGVPCKKQAWGAVAEHAQAILAVEPANAAGPPRARHRAAAPRASPTRRSRRTLQAEKLAGERLPEVHLARGVLLMRVKNECEPAIEALRAYARARRARSRPAESPVAKLQRECVQILEENRRAAEAAKQMQLEAERKAAAEAAKEAKEARGEAGGRDGARERGARRPHRRRRAGALTLTGDGGASCRARPGW